MIDREARDEFVQALKRFVGRRLSSYEIDDIVLRRTDDLGLAAVKGAAWTLYSDLENHFAEGRHELTWTQKKDVARWILFLRSDANYTHPKRSPEIYSLAMFFRPVLSALSLGAYGKWLDAKNRAFSDAGDLSMWPFASRPQMRSEIQRVDVRLRAIRSGL